MEVDLLDLLGRQETFKHSDTTSDPLPIKLVYLPGGKALHAFRKQGDLKANAMRLKRSLKQELEACEKLCRPEGVCQQESSKAVDLAIQVPNGIPLKAYVTQVPWVSQNALQGHRAHRKLA